jgi:DNA modification methylase
MSVKILRGDCRELLKTLPDESVHCVVTSPPYWGLRDYGTAQWEGGDADCKHAAGISNDSHAGPDAGNFRNGLAYVGQTEIV